MSADRLYDFRRRQKQQCDFANKEGVCFRALLVPRHTIFGTELKINNLHVATSPWMYTVRNHVGREPHEATFSSKTWVLGVTSAIIIVSCYYGDLVVNTASLDESIFSPSMC